MNDCRESVNSGCLRKLTGNSKGDVPYGCSSSNCNYDGFWGETKEKRSFDGRQRGFFVSFGHTKDAEQECSTFYKRTGRLIKLLTVQEILVEGHIQEM